MQKIYKLSTLLLSLLLVSCNGGTTSTPTSEPTTSGPQLPEAETNINSSINYQIFVRTFADSNGDGIGDLNGIKNKIPYLKKIGVKSIWLTPIHKTSSDHGYDVQDYYSIAKDLGTMEDFEALVQELKANDMGIILDMVFNHASNVTSYFKQAYQDFDDEMSGIIKSDSKADWFNFSLDKKIGYIKYKDYYVESRFNTTSMCDFNLENPEVIEEMEKILNFWAEKGVSGYRFDAVKYFVGEGVKDKTIEICNQLKAFQPNLYYVGEAWDESTFDFERYYESEFDAFFNFPMCAQTSRKGNLFGNTVNGSINYLYDSVLEMQKIITDNEENKTTKSVAANFLTNHDMDRVSSLTDDPNKLKLVASTTYLLPGTPFIYYGEELGMKGVRIATNTDADRRMPMLFEDNSKCNELRGTVFNEQIEEGVDTQLADPNSVLSHYIRVTSLRNKMGSMMKYATYQPYDRTLTFANRTFYAYNLIGEGKTYTVFTNLSHNSDFEFDIPTDFKSVLGYVNAKDYTIEYTLNEKHLVLPSYSTIILEN